MENKIFAGYKSPEMEVNEIEVEQGFAGSLLGGEDYNPNNPSETPTMPDEETDW